MGTCDVEMFLLAKIKVNRYMCPKCVWCCILSVGGAEAVGGFNLQSSLTVNQSDFNKETPIPNMHSDLTFYV